MLNTYIHYYNLHKTKKDLLIWRKNVLFFSKKEQVTFKHRTMKYKNQYVIFLLY